MIYLIMIIGFILFNILIRIKSVNNIINNITNILSMPLNIINKYIKISLLEITLFILIITLILIIILKIKKKIKFNFKKIFIFIYTILILYILFHGINYYRNNIYEELNFKELEIEETKYNDLIDNYIKKINELIDIKQNEDLFKLSDKELLKYGNNGYDNLNLQNLNNYEVTSKPLLLSSIYIYTGITGMYFPIYKEVNINMKTYKYSLPFTISHEIAHARGIAKEDEANFYAFISSINSNYFEYQFSGYYQILKYLINTKEQYNKLPKLIKQLYQEENNYYKKYEGIIDDISSFINNLFLKSQNQSGISSYNNVSKIIYSYYYKEE